MSVRLRLAIGIPFFALAFFYLCLRVYLGAVAPSVYSRRGWNAERKDGRVVIVVVGENAPATGALQRGDEIISLWSERPDATPTTTPDFWRVPPGTHYRLTINRAGQLFELPLRTTRIDTNSPEGAFFVFFIFTFLLFIGAGVTVFLLKPGDEKAWLLALMLTSFTSLFPLSFYLRLPWWVNLAAALTQLASTIFLPVMLGFFLVFPERSPLLKRFPRLKWMTYLPYLLFLLPLSTLETIFSIFQLSPSWRGLFNRWAGNSVTVLAVVYILAGLVAMAIGYRAASPVARRKLRVVLAGSGVGLLNIVLMPLGDLVELDRVLPTLWRWLDMGLLFTMPLIPLSFAYAIIRHQVIPIGLIIRRGMRYVLVSRGSVLLLMAVVSVVVFFAMDTFFYYLKPGSGRVVGVISAIVGIAVWQLARAFHLRMVAPKVDRLFFHQAYDAQQVIAELAESLRTTTSLSQLLKLVATKIQSAIQVANVTILLRDEASGGYHSAYRCVYSFHNRSAVPYPFDGRLSRDSAVITRLAESGQPIDLDGRDPQFALQTENGGSSLLSSEDLEALLKVESSLLLPITGKEGLLGIVSLGPHLGDLPFSSEDKRLLLSVSGPVSFALENIRLIERTIEDARRRQELEAENEQRAKELEGARQLQLSMLPKQIPQLPHLEIAAYMSPATEVGGDYYDFHLADDGTLTVAVGDATGHGLKAGTVVTAMKSLFHCYAGEPELIPVLNQSSRVLKKMNLRSLFMGLTVVKLNGRRLKISSAGMPPALVYRANEGTVEEVLIKAVPLGSVSNYSYRERELSLSCGDVVVLMSDGLPERFNRDGEMFDYSRTKQALAEAAARSSREIIEHFVRAGEGWANGRPQDDDMTFVVLKVK
jgi:serine phosphatase RsbU (regulator of sigma subunit)